MLPLPTGILERLPFFGGHGRVNVGIRDSGWRRELRRRGRECREAGGRQWMEHRSGALPAARPGFGLRNSPLTPVGLPTLPQGGTGSVPPRRSSRRHPDGPEAPDRCFRPRHRDGAAGRPPRSGAAGTQPEAKISTGPVPLLQAGR